MSEEEEYEVGKWQSAQFLSPISLSNIDSLQSPSPRPVLRGRKGEGRAWSG
jgi:hypothetical protein